MSIIINLNESSTDYSEYSTDLTVKISDEATATAAVEAFVRVLRTATYVDSSVYNALLSAASELEEYVTVSNTSIKEYNDK